VFVHFSRYQIKQTGFHKQACENGQRLNNLNIQIYVHIFIERPL